MSKNINVNPDHYKVAGRERPGQNIPVELVKQQYAQSRSRIREAEPGIGPQQSAKTGKRSSAQKEDRARQGYEPVPAANPVPGAFGGKKSNRRKARLAA